MNKNLVFLHLIPHEKVTFEFIKFVNDNFKEKEHKFIILGHSSIYSNSQKFDNVEYISIKNLLSLIIFMNNAKKIILHSLFSRSLIKLIFIQPWILKKCYHVMWGADFYFPEKQGFLKKSIIKRIGHFVTYVEGDYRLLQEWYKAKGIYHECITYPSNIYKEYNLAKKKNSTINIQLGNSADPSNNHIDILEKLSIYKECDIKIYIPLSYGNKEYAEKVVNLAREKFGFKVICITEFMPYSKYLDLLSVIDIAIFAHKRQQAMGNIITLLGLGKKIYINKDIVTNDFFIKKNIKVFDLNNINLSLIDNITSINNIKKIKEYFSEENLKIQLGRLFNE